MHLTPLPLCLRWVFAPENWTLARFLCPDSWRCGPSPPSAASYDVIVEPGVGQHRSLLIVPQMSAEGQIFG